MINAATHYGTCQACGRIQKLPKGLLSKHGCTVEHGWFSGVCRGAEFKPFEESCDQVERYILEVRAERERLQARQVAWNFRAGKTSAEQFAHDTAKAYAERMAASYEGRIKQLGQYISWQESRVASWKLMPLLPVKPKGKAADAGAFTAV